MKPADELAQFVANVRYDDIPDNVVEATKNLCIDWLGSTLAGARTRQATTLQSFAQSMGGAAGSSSDLTDGSKRSPYFAAMINAAASHVVEQDDLHNASVLHPATVVFPPVLALAEALNSSGKQVIAAAVAGYEAGIRTGEFLGRSHYVHFHTTGTAGTLAAAAAAANLLGLNPEQTRDAMGSAGTVASGLWEFLASAADSKQLHVAHAASQGLMAAWLARDGFKGAEDIFCGKHGMGAAMSSDSDPERLTDRLGTRWATAETSYKWHASCRHTHPSADALLSVIREHGIEASDIERIVANVHQGAIDVLGPVERPTTIHQAKFSMPTVLGLVANFGYAGLREFDAHALENPAVLRFLDRVSMQLDPDIDAAYPNKWMARVDVTLRDGRTLSAAISDAKGDPDNPLSRDEIIEKATSLARYGECVSDADVARWITTLTRLEEVEQTAGIFDRTDQNSASHH